MIWLTLVPPGGLALVVIVEPAIRRRSPDGQWLWRRAIRTEREDLRLGAAVLLLLATALTLIAAFTSDRDVPAPSRGTARTAAVQTMEDTDFMIDGSRGAAMCLVATAAVTMLQSCMPRSGRRMITL